MFPDSGRNWVCLFCRADSVRLPRSDAVGSPSQGTTESLGKPRTKWGKDGNIIQFMVVYSENHHTWWWFDAIYNPHNGIMGHMIYKLRVYSEHMQTSLN